MSEDEHKNEIVVSGPVILPQEGCIIKKMVNKWGPYLYHVKRVGKKQTWTYLGKASELARDTKVGKTEVIA